MKNKQYVAFIGPSSSLTEVKLDLNPSLEEVVEIKRSGSKLTLLKQLNFTVGLVDLADVSEASLKDLSEQIATCRANNIMCDWVGLVHPFDLESDGVRQWLRAECVDFWLHPFQRLRERLRQFLDRAAAQEVQSTSGQNANNNRHADLIGSSPSMHHLRQMIDRYARVNSPVLIIGETGSGKELIARSIHMASPRFQGKFMALNCGAIAPQLVQSELFGHERGAFTGANTRKIGYIEASNGGTLLLDEIGDLPLEAQASFLRFLQEGKITRVGGTEEIKVDIRIVAATHVNLEDAVSEAKFREDLLYRLNVLKIDVPPLRARGTDVLILAHHILNRVKQTNPNTARGFDPEATRALLAHTWPGNVRELSNRIHRAAVMCDRAFISPYELGLNTQLTLEKMGLDEARDKAEANAIEEALFSQGYNFSRAAKVLGISRVTLYRLASKHSARLSQNAMRDMPSSMPPNSNLMPEDSKLWQQS
jgi:DNA-binding NtrC family response regulator